MALWHANAHITCAFDLFHKHTSTLHSIYFTQIDTCVQQTNCEEAAYDKLKGITTVKVGAFECS